MNIANIPIVPTPGHALSASFNSTYQQVANIFGYCIQAVITGTPTGSIKIQMSNDPYQNIFPNDLPPVNWTDIANSIFAVTAAGNVAWNVMNPNYNWVRIVYTDTSSGA